MIRTLDNFYHRSSGSTEMSTTEIINEFVEQIDTDKAYSLKELKDALAEIYKAKSTGKTASKKTASKKKDDAVAAEKKPKKPPTAYNNFVKQHIAKLRAEQTEIPPRELMKVAAAAWKELTKQEQQEYKTVITSDEE
jgi:hypothetical protein